MSFDCVSQARPAKKSYRRRMKCCGGGQSVLCAGNGTSAWCSCRVDTWSHVRRAARPSDSACSVVPRYAALSVRSELEPFSLVDHATLKKLDWCVKTKTVLKVVVKPTMAISVCVTLFEQPIETCTILSRVFFNNWWMKVYLFNKNVKMPFWQQISCLNFIRPFETPAAGGRHPQGCRSLTQRVFIRSLSNLVSMLVCIMSQPSSMTSQIPRALLNYGPWIVQN